MFGPFLFALYSSVVKHGECHFYADGTQIFLSDKNGIQEMKSKLVVDWNGLNNVSTKHSLFLNTSKSKITLFTTPTLYRNLSANFNIKICEQTLETVS